MKQQSLITGQGTRFQRVGVVARAVSMACLRPAQRNPENLKAESEGGNGFLDERRGISSPYARHHTEHFRGCGVQEAFERSINDRSKIRFWEGVGRQFAFVVADVDFSLGNGRRRVTLASQGLEFGGGFQALF